MKYLKTYNETVWTSGKITGSRSNWTPIILEKIEDVGIVIDKSTWHEPPTRPYSMSHEMDRQRVSLSVQCGGNDVYLEDVVDKLYSLMEQLKGENIGTLDIVIRFNGSLNDEDPNDRTALKVFMLDQNVTKILSAHSKGIVTSIDFTFKYFTPSTSLSVSTNTISEYNLDYIKKYKSYFK